VENLPWIAWIVLAAIGVGAISVVMDGLRKIVKLRSGSTHDEVTASNREVLEKLDSIDLRLAKIEKTLDDVPA